MGIWMALAVMVAMVIYTQWCIAAILLRTIAAEAERSIHAKAIRLLSPSPDTGGAR